MRLTKLSIENFRGIRELDITFDRDITVLIGENNSGKTSVMEALRFGLEVVRSDKACNFTEYDFYRDSDIADIKYAQPIVLTYYFLETEEHPWPDHLTRELNEAIVGDDFSAIKLKITAFYDAENGITQRASFLDDADNERTSTKETREALRALKKVRPFFFQRALRAAGDEFHSKSHYWSSFISHKDIDAETQETLEKELFEINKKIVDAHFSFKDVAGEIQRISGLLDMNSNTTDCVSIDPTPVDLYHSLKYVADVNMYTNTDAKIPLKNHGEGTQSLSVLLLFSAYLKSRLKDVVYQFAEPIIAIEEPEAHLHPSAIRSVWNILDELPGQKIIATHSGDILSEVPVDKIRRLHKTTEGIKCDFISTGTLSPEEERKLNHHIRRNRGELFFAKKWLLVEGETDFFVFSECARLLKKNFHRNGIRVIEYAQAGGPGMFIAIADSLKINWCVIADADEKGKEYISKAESFLNGRDRGDFIIQLPHPNIDVLLCCNGFGAPYLDGIGQQKKHVITEQEGTPEYWEQVYKNLPSRFSKPAAASEAIALMEQSDPPTVPTILSEIIEKIIGKAGASQ